jgi:hypothetical protein
METHPIERPPPVNDPPMLSGLQAFARSIAAGTSFGVDNGTWDPPISVGIEYSNTLAGCSPTSFAPMVSWYKRYVCLWQIATLLVQMVQWHYALS